MIGGKVIVGTMIFILCWSSFGIGCAIGLGQGFHKTLNDVNEVEIEFLVEHPLPYFLEGFLFDFLKFGGLVGGLFHQTVFEGVVYDVLNVLSHSPLVMAVGLLVLVIREFIVEIKK